MFFPGTNPTPWRDQTGYVDDCDEQSPVAKPVFRLPSLPNREEIYSVAADALHGLAESFSYYSPLNVANRLSEEWRRQHGFVATDEDPVSDSDSSPAATS